MKQVLQKVYSKTPQQFFEEMKEDLELENKRFIITANPEILMADQKDEEIHTMLMDDATAIVADGIGAVKACQIVLDETVERIPGVDIVSQLFDMGHQQHKHLFILGAAQEVLDKLRIVLQENYPNLQIDGMVNGYVGDKDAVFLDIIAKQPDIVLVALGVPQQEKLIYKYLDQFKKGIFVGIGGSLDVLSGTKKRAPAFFIRCNLEWLYRILKEPKRIKRFYQNNVHFIFAVKKAQKRKS